MFFSPSTDGHRDALASGQRGSRDAFGISGRSDWDERASILETSPIFDLTPFFGENFPGSGKKYLKLWKKFTTFLK